MLFTVALLMSFIHLVSYIEVAQEVFIDSPVDEERVEYDPPESVVSRPSSVMVRGVLLTSSFFPRLW